MKKRRVWVMMGGRSGENAVSLISGTNVCRSLNQDCFEIYPLVLTNEGDWFWSSIALESAAEFDLHSWLKAPLTTSKHRPSLHELPPCDCAFLALHGGEGEDGHIQALLDLWEVPYTGSGMLASAICMDKVLSKEIYLRNQIPTPSFTVLHRAQRTEMDWGTLQYPVFIKDVVGGSSVGIGKAKDAVEAQALAFSLLEKCQRVLIEPLVVGREFSCGYLENEQALPSTEILVLEQEFFDYEAKYQGKSKEITPAQVSDFEMKTMQELARKCHECLGLRGYSRTDFLMDQKGSFWVLETNSLPGLTPQSLLPQQADCIGYSYGQLLEKIIERIP